ncbi:MAG: NAAT family transporter [Steroidobacteraceae bacterium]|jgi:multiple antibiotic resistance protein|nr:NAAT family transporter [Steroidobacteraceae bacterium]
MPEVTPGSYATFLLAFTALFSIVNPLGGAFIFFGATQDYDPRLRKRIARWVAIYAFAIVTFSLYVGAYVLQFFGISIPVLKVAGGIVIALSAWQLLSAPDERQQRKSAAASTVPTGETVSPSRVAFYPLTMPITTGPGTISVAISLGASRPAGFEAAWLGFVLQTMLATIALALLVWLLYRNSGKIARAVGGTGTTIIVRLSAFLLFCIGIQVFWNGASDLLKTL